MSGSFTDFTCFGALGLVGTRTRLIQVKEAADWFLTCYYCSLSWFVLYLNHLVFGTNKMRFFVKIFLRAINLQDKVVNHSYMLAYFSFPIERNTFLSMTKGFCSKRWNSLRSVTAVTNL